MQVSPKALQHTTAAALDDHASPCIVLHVVYRVSMPKATGYAMAKALRVPFQNTF